MNEADFVYYNSRYGVEILRSVDVTSKKVHNMRSNSKNTKISDSITYDPDPFIPRDVLANVESPLYLPHNLSPMKAANLKELQEDSAEIAQHMLNNGWGDDPVVPTIPEGFGNSLLYEAYTPDFNILPDSQKQIIRLVQNEWVKIVDEYNCRLVFKFLLDSVVDKVPLRRVIASKNDYIHHPLAFGASEYLMDWETFKKCLQEFHMDENVYSTVELVDKGTPNERFESPITPWNVIVSAIVTNYPQITVNSFSTGRNSDINDADQISFKDGTKLAKDSGLKILPLDFIFRMEEFS